MFKDEHIEDKDCSFDVFLNVYVKTFHGYCDINNIMEYRLRIHDLWIFGVSIFIYIVFKKMALASENNKLLDVRCGR